MHWLELAPQEKAYGNGRKEGKGRKKGSLISIFLSWVNHGSSLFEQYVKLESFDRWDLKFSWGSWYSCCC